MTGERRPDVGALFRFRAVAVVGASPRNRYALSVLGGLASIGFDGQVVCIHPRAEPVLGRPSYRRLSDVPHPLEAAVLVVRSELVPDLVEECAVRGIRAVTVISAGFAEAGEEGRELQGKVAAAARRYGVALCGPNCVGYLAVHERASTYARADLPARPGNVAVVSSSGGILNEILSYGSTRGIGFSYAVSAGNGAVLDISDYLEFFVEDDRTDAIGLVVEGMRAPGRLRAILEAAAAARKPVVAIKIGFSSLAARAAATHTGALAGSGEIFAALCRQSGVSLVPDVDALCEQLLLFARAKGLLRSPRPTGGAAVIEISGGGKGLVCDLAERHGVPLPTLDPACARRLAERLPAGAVAANPLDVLTSWEAPGSVELHQACLDALGGDPGIEVILSRLTVAPQGDISAALAHGRVIAEAQRAHPDCLYAALSRASDRIHDDWQALCAKEGLTYLQGYGRGLEAVGALIAYRRFLQRRMSCGAAPEAHGRRPPEPAHASPPDPVRSGGEGVVILDEVAAKDMLAEAGLPVNPTRFAADVEEAVRLARRVGFPVVLKGISPHAVHKSDLGLVALPLEDEAHVRAAAARLLERVLELGDAPSGERVGLSIQPLLARGAEVIVGGYRDEGYGPVILCGLGGTSAEVVADRSLRLAPIDARDAAEMIAETRIPRLAGGFRDLPPFALEALERLLITVGRWMASQRHVRELDLNPVICRGAAVHIADARVVLDSVRPSARIAVRGTGSKRRWRSPTAERKEGS